MIFLIYEFLQHNKACKQYNKIFYNRSIYKNTTNWRKEEEDSKGQKELNFKIIYTY